MDIYNVIIMGCRELGIGIVPYSPLGQGFFCAGSKVAEGMKDDDLRKVINLSHLIPFS